MNVRLFGIDIEITVGFWMTVVLFSVMGGDMSRGFGGMILWAFVLLLSVLIHELGHALAYRAFGVRSSIRLHFLGGMTMPSVLLPLSRPKRVFVSAAGPLAGFLLMGVSFALLAFARITHPGFHLALSTLFMVNLYWSILNLAPVLPLDGGHIVEHALGPRRVRITLWISGIAGALLAVYGLMNHGLFFVYIFGAGAVQSFIQLRETTEAVRHSREAAEVARPSVEPLPSATVRALKEAKLALAEDDFEKAIDLARGVLEGRELEGGRPHSRAIPEALTVLGWAHLGRGETAEAVEAVSRLTRMAHGDPALVASVAIARGDDMGGRRLLEAARAAGDDRKEVFGPLIQILLRQNEPARAAALALDCAESISSDDLRVLAGMTSEHGAPHWAARLHEQVFKRERNPEDAFEAARAYARASDPAKAIDMMRRAVQAGFTDSGRVYADQALVGIDELEHILPR